MQACGVTTAVFTSTTASDVSCEQLFDGNGSSPAITLPVLGSAGLQLLEVVFYGAAETEALAVTSALLPMFPNPIAGF